MKGIERSGREREDAPEEQPSRPAAEDHLEAEPMPVHRAGEDGDDRQ